MWIAAIAASGAVASSLVTGVVTWWITRRRSRDAAKQLDVEQSGEFRRDVLTELQGVREDNRAMRSELTEHEARCENKIREHVHKAELECEEMTTRKLASQARQIRAEYEPRLNEMERRLGELSEPL